MFGNGLSSSPSDTEDYPMLVTIYDNVQVQRRALADLFGIDRVACVYGWSMGALQAYHWAALFPDAVERIVVNCGVARTAVHNQVFLRSLMATLEAAPQHIGNGRFSAEPRAAKRAFGRIYAAWALPVLRHSSRPTGRTASAHVRQPTFMPSSAPGMLPISAPTTCMTAIWARRCGRSGPACC